MSTELPQHWFNPTRISNSVQTVVLVADEKTAGPIAGAIGVERVISLEVKLDICGWNARGIKIAGAIIALFEQNCVATLEPMQNTVSTDFIQHFVPEKDSRQAMPEIVDGEMMLEAEGDDLPDVFTNNRIDLWAVAVEQLILVVDLFPRSDVEHIEKEEVLSPPVENQTYKPFADLKTLITKKNTQKDP